MYCCCHAGERPGTGESCPICAFGRFVWGEPKRAASWRRVWGFQGPSPETTGTPRARAEASVQTCRTVYGARVRTGPCQAAGRKALPGFLAALLAGRTSLRRPRRAVNAKLLTSRSAGTGLSGSPRSRPKLAGGNAGTIGSRPQAEHPSIHARWPEGRRGADALCGAVRSPTLMKLPDAVNKHCNQISPIIVHKIMLR